jgi:hypothetical protein
MWLFVTTNIIACEVHILYHQSKNLLEKWNSSSPLYPTAANIEREDAAFALVLELFVMLPGCTGVSKQEGKTASQQTII